MPSFFHLDHEPHDDHSRAERARDENAHGEQRAPQDWTTIPEGASASVLVLESRSVDAPQEAARVISVPAAPSKLVVADDESPSTPGFVSQGAEPQPVSHETLPERGQPVFEHVVTTTGATLLMLNSPGSGVRLNGLPAPLVAPLSPGDQLSLGTDSVFHVSRVQCVTPVKAPAEIVGTTCEVCLVEFTPDTCVVVCACGSARHMEGEEVSVDERLECALLGACQCGCERPTSSGLSFWPAGVS